MNTRVFENDYVKFEYRDDIVIGTYKVKNIDLALAKKIVQDRLAFSRNKPIPLLITEWGLKGIEREARSYLSSDEGVKGILASAIVTRSAVSTYLANFFLRISVTKPKIPARVFTTEEQAVEWLRSFLKE